MVRAAAATAGMERMPGHEWLYVSRWFSGLYGMIFQKKYFHESYASGYIVRAKISTGVSGYTTSPVVSTLSNTAPRSPTQGQKLTPQANQHISYKILQMGLTSSGFPLLGALVGGSSCGVIVLHVPLSLS